MFKFHDENQVQKDCLKAPFLARNPPCPLTVYKTPSLHFEYMSIDSVSADSLARCGLMIIPALKILSTGAEDEI